MRRIEPSHPANSVSGLRASTAPASTPAYQEPARGPRRERASSAVQVGRLLVVKLASGVAVQDAAGVLVREPRKALALLFSEMLIVQNEQRAK